MRRDPTSENSDLYEFKMPLFDNGKPEGFLFFIWEFNMTLEASVMLKSGTKIQYLCTLVHGEELCPVDTLSSEAGSSNPENLTYIILGLGK